jgi:tRNA nucleotidyltransferase/poly(A) polymerase
MKNVLTFAQFKNGIDETTQSLLAELSSHFQLKFLWIGGGPRRQMMGKTVAKHDLDLELWPAVKPFDMTPTELKEALSLFLGKFIQERGLAWSVEEFHMGVWKVKTKTDEIICELSLPRLEMYPHQGVLGHRDFQVQWSWDLTWKEALGRRDFSVNSFGPLIDFQQGEAELIDIHNGLTDVEEKVLRAVEPNHFVKDPVRFLRAIRFEIAEQFLISSEVRDLMMRMDISTISAHYFLGEMLKSLNPKKYLQHLLEYSISLPVPQALVLARESEWEEWEFDPQSPIENTQDLAIEILFQLVHQIDEKDYDVWVDYLQVKHKLARSLWQAKKAPLPQGLKYLQRYSELHRFARRAKVKWDD